MLKKGIIGVVILAAACSSNPAPQNGADAGTINIGYGTQSARAFAGSASTITAEQVKNEHFNTIGDMLEARVPGLEVIRRGNDYSLRIRGTGAYMPGQEPLIVIDGMPTSEFLSAGVILQAIDPENVARIDVLKDGASSAIYGVRGEYGVILITTKR